MGLLDWFRTKQKKDQLAAISKSAANRPQEKWPRDAAQPRKEKAEKKSAEVAPQQPVRQITSTNANAVLTRQIVTEKSTAAEAQRQYTFEVSRTATKTDVARAVRSLYNVQPTAVRIQRYDGKRVRYGRHVGQRRAWKKAIVTVAQGQSITVSEKKS